MGGGSKEGRVTIHSKISCTAGCMAIDLWWDLGTVQLIELYRSTVAVGRKGLSEELSDRALRRSSSTTSSCRVVTSPRNFCVGPRAHVVGAHAARTIGSHAPPTSHIRLFSPSAYRLAAAFVSQRASQRAEPSVTRLLSHSLTLRPLHLELALCNRRRMDLIRTICKAQAPRPGVHVRERHVR